MIYRTGGVGWNKIVHSELRLFMFEVSEVNMQSLVIMSLAQKGILGDIFTIESVGFKSQL